MVTKNIQPEVDVLTFTPSFSSFMEREIFNLSTNKRLGTAKNYRSAKKSLHDFFNKDEILFSEFTPQQISEYERWLEKKELSRNTISFYMRILRSVYNKAVEQQLASENFPFYNVYTGIDRTRKRAIDVNIIKQLQNLDLTKKPCLAYARDLFIFSFYTRGMAFIDMAFLKKREVREGRLQYIRHKTGKTMSIKIEPCMQEIIKRYAYKTIQSKYLLPIIRPYKPKDEYTQYQNALSYYNKQLKKLSKLLRLKTSLSSYVSRHTWATTARNKNIPLSVISAGMGHSSEVITEIYLASLDTSLVDDANGKILQEFL